MGILGCSSGGCGPLPLPRRSPVRVRLERSGGRVAAVVANEGEQDPIDEAGRAVAAALEGRDRRVAVAESLTGGLLANALARVEGSGDWFLGGVVAYASEVKHDVLGVPPGPVVSAPAATAMAEGVADLLRADVGLAVTGVGGPDPQDGRPVGTVWIGLAVDGRVTATEHRFDGDPPSICEQTCLAACRALADRLGGGRDAR